MTELCELAEKYGSDKCPKINHSYTPYYYELFSPIRNKVKKVLEIGIGDDVYRNRLKEFNPILGGSLKMWKDFFPNAQIYGVDIDPKTMFTAERIETIICDQADPEALKELIKKIGDVDIVIDDGSHQPQHQVISCRTLMPLLPKDVIYIIEDVKQKGYVMHQLRAYNCSVPTIEPTKVRDARYNQLVLVQNK